MSDSEGESCFYGKPLEPYDEDAFPKKKPITVEEQVAKDAQGRRRFHGAFTGGFSAGFFNTVGSLEGWTPQDFKSSRAEKALNVRQKPEDFMDDEDIGEFGIAPQTVRATKEYSSDKKRKRHAVTDGPIPGEPVLETLLEAGNETVGYFLMKNMNRNQRKAAEAAGPKIYGCAMPTDLPEEEVKTENEYKLHEVYKQNLLRPKSNTFGLGYIGLDKTHLNLFQPANLKVRERNNKKVSISGQAFGVGAFEDEDEDIYVKDDMTRYDFELTSETSSNSKKSAVQELVLEMFVLSKTPLVSSSSFPLPVVPSSFSGKHNIKKSRFEPLPEEQKTLKRGEVNASVRAKYLGEAHSEKTYTPSNQQHKQMHAREANKPVKIKEEIEKPEAPSSSGLLDRFVSAKQDDDLTNILQPVKPTETTHGTAEMHAAVRMKMFGPLTRVTVSWQPCPMLCRRFNVPEPNFDFDAGKNKKRTKNLIFEYQKHSEEDKAIHKPGLFVPSIPQTTPDLAPPTSRDDSIEGTPKTDSQQSNILQETVKEPKPEPEAEPSTEQQKTLDITERVDVSKNTDLFKAVFLSSSESESETENDNAQDELSKKKELLTASVLSEPLLPKIKSTKEGILSNIDFSKMSTRIKENDGNDKQKTADSTREETDSYGPRLPEKIVRVNSVVVGDVNNDEWVERSELKEVKRHKKKHKKDKKKHKHKSKK